jgi:kinase suppressor of Ras 2
LVAKAKIKSEELPKEVKDVPSVKQWLQVVGVSQASVESLCTKIQTLEVLQEMSDHEIRRLCNECGTKEDELRRLIRALQNLRRYTGLYDQPPSLFINITECFYSFLS